MKTRKNRKGGNNAKISKNIQKLDDCIKKYREEHRKSMRAYKQFRKFLKMDPEMKHAGTKSSLKEEQKYSKKASEIKLKCQLISEDLDDALESGQVVDSKQQSDIRRLFQKLDKDGREWSSNTRGDREAYEL
jgi:hypothetical protein